jgi:NitT/TauT family transport system substrate-binding protein
MNFAPRLPVLAFAAACAASSVAPARAELQTLRLTMPAIATYYAPYMIAMEKGYYADEGLAIEVTYAGGGAATPALMSGTMDISTSPAAALTAIMRGAPLKIVYTMADRSNYQLWSTQPDITTLQALKGKSVGILSRGDTFEIAMRLTLLHAGLPQDWVGYTPLGVGDQARAAAIASGSLPAVILARSDLEPLRNTGALQRGHLVVDIEKTIQWPYTGVVVGDTLIKNKPDALLRFMRATVKGVRYVKAYRAETIAVLLRHEPQASEKQFATDYDDSIQAMTADGTASDAMIQQDLDVRAQVLNIPKDKIRPIDQIYDYRAVREATREVDASGWKPVR